MKNCKFLLNLMKNAKFLPISWKGSLIHVLDKLLHFFVRITFFIQKKNSLTKLCLEGSYSKCNTEWFIRAWKTSPSGFPKGPQPPRAASRTKIPNFQNFKKNPKFKEFSNFLKFPRVSKHLSKFLKNFRNS